MYIESVPNRNSPPAILLRESDRNRAVRKLSCAAQYQVMAFAQLTYRESLRDIEACLPAQTAKLYHMGVREPVRRSTLADANESRDWRIYAEFAQRLIARARRLYARESLEVDLPTPFMRWTPRPSTYACLYSLGRTSGPPSPP